MPARQPRQARPHSPAPPRRDRLAFTLVELLVVLGITGVLVGMLLPVLAAARRSARQAACASNLRQWAAAANLYAAQNHNSLPRRGQGVLPTTVIDRDGDWFNALPAVLRMPTYKELIESKRPPTLADGGVWICPEVPDLPGGADGASGGYLFPYGMNMRLSTWLTPQPDRIDRVGDASTLVFMADAPSGYCSVMPAAAPYSPAARHSGRVNLAFLDGHVASYTGAEVGCGVGDPERPDVRWIVPGSPWNGPKTGP